MLRNWWVFPVGSDGKESTCNVGDPGSIPGLGRSPGEGNDNPLHSCCLENSMDCIVHGVAKSWTQLSSFHSSLQEIWVQSLVQEEPTCLGVTKPMPQYEVHATQLESGPHSLQLEKSPCNSEDPVQSKTLFKEIKK